jgi:hypothetical protein
MVTPAGRFVARPQRRLKCSVSLSSAPRLSWRPRAPQPSSPRPRRSRSQQSEAGAGAFVGYWMGIDPLDGGDSRRGITRNHDGTFSLIGRDTVFTLCDGTDRAIVSDGDLTRSGRAFVSDTFTIKCTNTNSQVVLKARYEVVGKNVVLETLTSQTGDPVDKILFHRVSRG